MALSSPGGAVVGMVWAQTPGGVIAADGDEPWDVPEDFQHFRDTVAGRPVVVGRRTWESMPKPWRRRRAARSVVVTRDPEWAPEVDDDVLRAGSLTEAVELAAAGEPPADEVWIMGGGQVYALGIALADLLVVSEIEVPEPSPDADLTLGPAVDPAVWAEATPPEVAGWRTARTGTRWRIRHYRRS